MGQVEVLNWLVKKHNKGEKQYLTSKEIHEGMKKDGLQYHFTSVRRCLFPLCSYGYLDTVLVRTGGFGTLRKYRASKKAIKELNGSGK